MSAAPVGALAVLDTACRLHEKGAHADAWEVELERIHEARAAVAELIEAATRLEEISVCMNTAQSDRLTRLTTALSRCKGGAQ